MSIVRGKRTAWFAILAMLLSLGSVAMAVDTVHVDSSVTSIDNTDYLTIEDAFNAINADVTSSGTANVEDVEITLSDDQTVTGTDGMGSALRLDGNNGAAYPSESSGLIGFNDVTLDGNGQTITMTGQGRVLEIVNVANDLVISDLGITGGNLTGTALDYAVTKVGTGGGGMYLGGTWGERYDTAASGTAMDGSDAPATISLANVDVYGNTVNLNANGIDANASGGGIYVYGMGGIGSGSEVSTSDVTFTSVNLTGNTLRIAGDSTTLSNVSSMGGGARIAFVDTFIFAGTATDAAIVADNLAYTAYGSHAAGGGIAFDGNSATLNDVIFLGNTAQILGNGTHDGVNPTDAWAYGGGFYANSALSVAYNITMTDVDFVGNSAIATGGNRAHAMGGGVALLGITGSINFTDVLFFGNSVSSADGNAFGGGLAIRADNAATVSLTDSSFIGNSANGANALGGAIYVNTGGLASWRYWHS